MVSRAFFAVIFVFCFLIHAAQSFTQTAEGELSRNNENKLFSLMETKLETKVGEYVGYFTRYLEDFNDRHLGSSALGRFLHYDEIKPILEKEGGRSARMKKMAMAMMPLVFHIGAMSTWMLVTTLLTAKGVAIGMTLLIFKIAVSAAKLAAFFTAWKGKHDDHHHGWHEYHGHERSFSGIEHIPTYHSDHPPSHHSDPHPSSSDWHSYAPEWTPNEAPDYQTISNYNNVDSKNSEYSGPYLHAEDRNKKLAERKKFT